ncbi:CAMK family protein kinase [Tritrichomonas foetus]|uniref:CAMK family protein kinase n=1 Tax=Tritrichomonas foetus TaxID=1144522 RepID=A0A1J4KQR7_9EUKA|nr:CAMK family protein kinase [Tritrichomonas foetus]|eukprot:OHT12140.1 CAMK family protein kinase [Tritrichomonas foetus]
MFDEECFIEMISKILVSHGYLYVKKLGSGGNGSVHLVNSLKWDKRQFAVKIKEIREESLESDDDSDIYDGKYANELFGVQNKNPKSRLSQNFKSSKECFHQLKDQIDLKSRPKIQPHGSSPNLDDHHKKDEHEIEMTIKLNHPNIVALYEYFYERNLLFIVMEYCPNGTLNDLIENFGHLSPPYLYNSCLQILDAMYLCHSKNIAHRDIKPANILIDGHGRFVLADFGISNEYKQGECIKSTRGSRQYLAPEIYNAEKNIDPFKLDIWALGVTFFQMAVGALPWPVDTCMNMEKAISIGFFEFPSQTGSSADSDVPLKFQRIVKDMMEINPKLRPTVSQIKSRIDDLMNGQKLPTLQIGRYDSAHEALNAKKKMSIKLAKSFVTPKLLPAKKVHGAKLFHRTTPPLYKSLKVT